MRAADEVHPRVFDHLDVAVERRVGDAVAPARVVLMDVAALNPVVRAVQRETLRRRPAEPTEPERRGEDVHAPSAV